MSVFSSTSTILLLFLLLLCHSMHACEGRRLGGGIIGKEQSRKHVHHSVKDVEKTILEKTSVSSKKNPFLSETEELIPMRKQRITNHAQNHVGASSTTTTTTTTTTEKLMKNNHQKAMLNDEVLHEQETKRIPNNPGFVHQIESLVSVTWRVPKKKHNEHPGNEIVMFSDVGLQQSTKIEESERRGRSVLGSESHDSEETIESKKSNDVEDVGVMDYEQPRRKPPIHNLSP